MHWDVFGKITWIFPVPSVWCLSLLLHSRSWCGKAAQLLAADMAIHHHPHSRTISHHRVLLRIIPVLHITDSNTLAQGPVSQPELFYKKVKTVPHPTVGGGEWMAVWGCFAGLTHKIVFSEKILELPCIMF